MRNKPRLLLTALLLFSLHACGLCDSRYMKAFGHEVIKLYRWNPEFDKAHHCIFVEFFFRAGYLDEKEKMEQAGFDTSASTECTKWSEWCVLRIDPRNVEYIEYRAAGSITKRLDNREIMKLCGLNE